MTTFREPETVTVRAARAMTSLGTTKIYELLASGDLESCKVGRRRLIRTESIRRLISAQAPV